MIATDVIGLAERLAEIARRTTDPATGRQLMDIVHELMTAAELPDGTDPEGGGEPPPADWRHTMPVDSPAQA